MRFLGYIAESFVIYCPFESFLILVLANKLRNAGLTMVFKLCCGAEKRWKKFYGYEDLRELSMGIKFKDGVKIDQVGKVA